MSAENDWRVQVDRLDLREGDWVLLRHRDTLSRDEVQQFVDAWREAYSDYRLIVIDGGMEITALSDEQLAELGLQRVADAG